MTRDRTVVVGVDGSACSAAAIAWASDYADLTESALLLMVAWQWPMSYGVPVGYEGFDPAEDARKIGAAAAADVPLAAGRVRVEIAQGSPGDVLSARSANADLLVVGSRGHGTLTGALLGSTSDYCVHHADCPVVVIRCAKNGPPAHDAVD